MSQQDSRIKWVCQQICDYFDAPMQSVFAQFIQTEYQ